MSFQNQIHDHCYLVAPSDPQDSLRPRHLADKAI